MDGSSRPVTRIGEAVRSDRVSHGLRRWWPAAAALVVAAVMFTATPAAGSASPDTVVRTYLTAIHNGDVERALSIAGGAPGDESGRFATEVGEQDWRVAALDTRWSDSGSVAEVSVTIDNTDTTGSGVFRLVRGAHGWHITNPFVRVRFGASPLGFAQLGSSTVDVAPVAEQWDHLLLPGRHDFYTSLPDTVDVTMAPRLLLPGNGTVTIRPDGVTLTEQGEDMARQAVESFVDECAERADRPVVSGCPFSAANGLRAWVDDAASDEPVTWRVVDRPTVSFVSEPDASIAVVDDEVGRVDVSGTRRSFRVECQIQARWLTLTALADGGFAVRHLAGNLEEDWRRGDFPDPSINTCVG